MRYVRGMAQITRVLDPEPVRSFEDYRQAGGGRGLEAARKLGPAATIEEIEASGLRGRGGAGFPTGRKWAAVAANDSSGSRPTVVVNASEGEPGSFKDRMLLRRNPYRIIEGAIIAAEAVDAERIVFALKASFQTELERLRTALAEVEHAGLDGPDPRRLRRSLGVSVRRGDRAPRGGRRPGAVPPYRPALPPRRRGRRPRPGLGRRLRHGHAGRADGGRSHAGQQRRDDRQRPLDPGRGRDLVPRRSARPSPPAPCSAP